MKYSKEKTAEICKYIEEGNTQKDACTLSGISTSVFHNWKNDKVEFMEAIKVAEAKAKEAMIAIVRKAAIKSWAAAAWWLERRHKEEYALRTEMTGKDGKDLDLIKVSIPKDLNGIKAN